MQNLGILSRPTEVGSCKTVVRIAIGVDDPRTIGVGYMDAAIEEGKCTSTHTHPSTDRTKPDLIQ